MRRQSRMYIESKKTASVQSQHPRAKLVLALVPSLLLFFSFPALADQVRLRNRVVIGKVILIDKEKVVVTNGCESSEKLAYVFSDIVDIALTSKCSDPVSIGHGSAKGDCSETKLFFIVNFTSNSSALVERVSMESDQITFVFNEHTYAGSRNKVKSIKPYPTCKTDKFFAKMVELSRIDNSFKQQP